MFVRSFRAAVLATAAATAAAACSSDSDSDYTCTAIGCPPPFSIESIIDGAAAEVPQMTIEVCLNNGCLTGSFAQSEVPDGSSGAAVTFPDPVTSDATQSPHVDAFITATDAAGSLRLRLQYYAWTQRTLADGDVYSITVRRGSTVVASMEKAVVYTRTQPNGPRCDPEPCLSSVN